MTWVKCSEKQPPLRQIVPVIWKDLVVFGEYVGEAIYIYLLPSNMFQEDLIKYLPPIGSEIEPTHWMEIEGIPNELD